MIITLPTLQGRTLPAFPCKLDKRPLTKHGFENATTDPNEFAKSIPSNMPYLFGVATGKVSGIDVLDIDKEGFDWFASVEDIIPTTRIHRTRSGGMHLLFNHHSDLHCSISKITNGVDVRADGGYIIWWPSAGFDAEHEDTIHDWPVSILDKLLTPKLSPLMGTPDSTNKSFGKRIWMPFKDIQRLLFNSQPGETEIIFIASQGCPYRENFSFLDHPYMGRTVKTFDSESLYALQAAVQSLLELNNAEIGDRNRTLNACAFGLGRLLARGWVRFDIVVRALWRGAVNCRLVESDGPESVIATIQSGIKAGMKQPYPDLKPKTENKH